MKKTLMKNCSYYLLFLMSFNVKANDTHIINYTSDSYIIEYQQGQLPESILAKVNVIGRTQNNIISRVSLSKSELFELSAIYSVSIEENYSLSIPQADMHVINMRQSEQRSINEQLNQQEIEPYWHTLTGVNLLPEPTLPIKACVIDSGVEIDHPDLPQNTHSGYHSAYAGFWNQDSGSHGTHLVGIMSALKNNIGIKGVISNGNLKLHIHKLLKTSQGENSRIRGDDLINAIEICANSGAKIVNMSLSSSHFSSATRNVIDRLSYDRGIIFVASAGNHGDSKHQEMDPSHFPASYRNVISVGAINKNKKLAYFSPINTNVSVVAPGVAITSSVNNNKFYIEKISYQTENNQDLSLTFEQIDIGLKRLPNRVTSADVCHYSLPEKLVNLQKKHGSLPQESKLHLQQITAQCQAKNGKVLLLNYDVKPHNKIAAVDFYTDFPTLLTSEVINHDNTYYFNFKSSKSNYAIASGTSQAAAIVSAGIAKLWALHPTLTRNEIMNGIFKTTVDLGPTGKDNGFGYGLVDFYSAHLYLNSPESGHLNNSCPESWYSNRAYKADDRASWQGYIYQANYWSKSVNPSTDKTPSWQKIGQCPNELKNTSQTQDDSYDDYFDFSGLQEIKVQYKCNGMTLSCSKT